MPSFDSRGFSIYYEVHGDAAPSGSEETPLLLIMGMGGTCQGWTVVTTPELSLERPNIVFDNRGAGRSQDPGEPFTTRDLAEDARAVLDELGIGRAHVMGGFLGGMVAQELAIAHPDRVDRLVLVGSYARPDARRRAVLELWKAMAEYEVPAEVRVKNLLCWTVSDATMEQTDLIEGMWRFYLQESPMDPKSYLHQVEACLGHDTRQRLDQIQAPTLIVCGEDDILTPLHLSRELAERIPDSRLVPVSNAGHLVIAELAPRVNRLVSRFLSGIYA